MCGILCLLSLTNKSVLINDLQLQILKHRGPNSTNQSHELNKLLTFFGFVLWQQGDIPFQQPSLSKKFILLLNGDIFNILKPNSISDTQWLLEQLDKCDNQEAILKLITSLEGPYSIIFYDRQERILYFARDPLGRNSLLAEYDKDQECIKITSTSHFSSRENSCIEVPPVGLYKVNLSLDHLNNKIIFKNIELYLWKDLTLVQKERIENIFNCDVKELSKVNIEYLQTKEINNYFDFYELVKSSEIALSDLLLDKNVSFCVCKILELLRNSIKDRIINTPEYCSICISSKQLCHHSKIGILFSGGLDCSILAYLSHEFCNEDESIDLINVAFQNVNCKDDDIIDWNTPDRITAIKSYNEIKKLLPNRKWNLVLVNVKRNELYKQLTTNIKHLIYPLNTVLDESLGASFWFASRGIGILENSQYETTCRIVLIGSGADELFGGYTRHRNAFIRTQGNLENKLKALENELRLDWERIAFRNLGRDDRVIADNCKTARSPYIEEKLVSFVTNLKPEQKCCFNLKQGLGDKLLLRLCALKLGLKESFGFQKRAIQFGSKIADKKQNATDISKFLTNL